MSCAACAACSGGSGPLCARCAAMVQRVPPAPGTAPQFRELRAVQPYPGAPGWTVELDHQPVAVQHPVTGGRVPPARPR